MNKKERKKIVEVNVPGMMFVVGIFLFTILLMFEINLGIVSAAASDFSATTWRYSANAQFYRPGAYQTFSQSQASIYWPILSTPDKCEATTDFLMFIRPRSCSPMVVRSDLLEEQNVPVFCKVDVVKINPLVDITKLKSVKFTGDYGQYVSGVSFHPNNDAIYSNRVYLDNPLINDAGYVVVVLKRIQAEKDMPDEVKINLTGVLRYDSEGIYGPGQNTYYLETEDDDTKWELGDNYKENSIFKGEAYLRAEWIEPDSARISIYRDKDTRLNTFNLKKGETSGTYYMPGFYCKARVKVRLDDVVAGVKKVLLEVDDNQIWLVEGQKFLDNKCKVDSISVNDKTMEKSVKISCTGGKSTILRYKGTNGTKENGEVTTTETLQKLIDDNFEKTKTYAENIENYYGSIANSKNPNEIWAGESLYLLGTLAEKINKTSLAAEIFARVVKDYPGTSYANSASLKLSSMGSSEGVSYKGVYIKLLEIKTPTIADASADFIVKKIDKNQEKPVNGTSAIQESKTFSNGKFKLLKLYSDKVYLEYFPVKDEKDYGDKKFYLSYGDTERKGDYVISLANINYTQVAKVSVIADMPNEYSESDFIFDIGIEKRGIELSPGKTRDMIENLNKTIKQWEGIIDRLGKVVEAMKGACFATSAILIAKNFFANLGGGATARQKVMPMWYQRCEREYGKDRISIDKCLKDKSSEIEKDISLYQKNVEDVNNEMTALQKANVYVGTDNVNRNAVLDEYKKQFTSPLNYEYELYDETSHTNKTIIGTITVEQLQKASLSDLRDIKLNQMLAGSGVSDVTKTTSETKLKEIALRLSKKQEDVGLYSNSDDSWINLVMPRFYDRGENKGLVSIVPIPGAYAKSGVGDGTNSSSANTVTGFYAVVEEGLYGKGGGYTAAGDIKEFTIKNLGTDGQKDSVGDRGLTINMAYYADLRGQLSFPGLDSKQTQKLIDDAIQAIKEANRNYGQRRFNLLGKNVVVDMAGAANEARCQDFMSPSDCNILFNICDPVICPSSRCDLGGAYRVDDVIQSGIIGSIALCLPNYKEGILVPVCLSGIHAGLQSFVSILKSHRDCLQESLDSGRMVGICDEIYSIYLCEFFWRQIGPFLDMLIMKMIEGAYGQGMKGGGEYLTVQDAWTQASNSINYLKNDYAVNAYKAFQLRSTGDIGTEFCKVFVSAKYPNKGFFDNLIKPDSPVQFSAWFDEIPYTEATVPATSQYKVFYHIWAGEDIGASYQVYLKEPGESAYVNVQDWVIVDTGYINAGGYKSEAKDFTAPAGYKQLCVRINGQDECGFKKVSTDFAINYISDQYYEDQLENANIRTKQECISGSPSVWGITQSPNIQEGVQNAITPNIEKEGVIRICSSDNPGGTTQPERWLDSGFCDDESVRCWLDRDSVKNVIKNKNLSADIIKTVKNYTQAIDVPDFMDPALVETIFADAKKTIDFIEQEATSESSIRAILETQNTGVYKGKSLLAIIEKLNRVEENAQMNNEKAEAVYYKFLIYYTITDKLALIANDKMASTTSGTAGTTSEIIGGEACGAEDIFRDDYIPEAEGTIIRDNNGNYWKYSDGWWYQFYDSGEIIRDTQSDPADIPRPVCYVSRYTQPSTGGDETGTSGTTETKYALSGDSILMNGKSTGLLAEKQTNGRYLIKMQTGIWIFKGSSNIGLTNSDGEIVLTASKEILTKDLLTIMNDLVDNYKLVDGKFVKKSGEASATATPVTSPKGEELDVHPENYIHKFSNEDIYECFSYFEDSDLWGWYFVAGKSSETNGRICEDSFNQGTILSPTKWEFYPSRYQEGSLVEGYNLILEAFSNKQGTLSHMRKS